MERSRTLILVAGLVAVGGGITAYVWHARSAPTSKASDVGSATASSTASSTSSTTPSTSASTSAATKAPELPKLPGEQPALPSLPELPAGTVAQQFADESRDPEWAPKTEAAIKERLTDVPATVTPECRSEKCQLVVDGSMKSVDKTIAMIEREDHIRGIAKHILLGKPEQRPDGSLSLKLYVLFDR